MKLFCYCSGESYFRLNFPSFIASVKHVYGRVPVHLAAWRIPETLLRRAQKLLPTLYIHRLRSSDHWKIVNEDDRFIGPNQELIASAKTRPWRDMYDAYSKPGDRILFCDVDVVHLKRAERYFDADFDVAYTYYSNPHPVAAGPDPCASVGGVRLNSGVILAKHGAGAKAFFKRWEQLSRKVKSPPAFGGHDQEALVRLLSGAADLRRVRSLPRKRVLSLGGVEVRIQGYPCKELNEPEAIGRIPAYTHILHFKGEWKPLLQHGWKAVKGTVRDRPYARQQYEIWKRFRSKAKLA